MCNATTDAQASPPAAESGGAEAAPRPTLRDIFQQFGPAYRAKYGSRMSREQLRVMWNLERCRTGELGSVVYRCEQCGDSHVLPRSCGDRHCPCCQGQKARQWLDQQLAGLLPCVYFLVTFTLPSELREFVRRHRRRCYDALFQAAAATLRELAKNPRHIGSDRLGFTGVLHTWGRSSTYHPHVHFIVPGGALSADGERWLPSRVNFLAPVEAASLLFREKFRELLRQHGLLDAAPATAFARDWVVHCKAVGDGRRALRYLAPYVYRIALSNRRIVRCETDADGVGRVTFMCRPSGTRKYRPMTVTADEFIRRFLQHVLPRGLQKVRYYGFAHQRQRVDRERLQMLVTVTLNQVYSLIVAAQPLVLPPRLPCPRCGGPLACIAFVGPSEHEGRKVDSS
jgi:hypothetical protein